MSWDNVWPLPRTSYAREEVERAVAKAIGELGATRLPDKPYIDWEEEEASDDDDKDDDSWAFNVSIPRKVLVDHGDEPAAHAEYECVFTVALNILGDDTERWEVCVHSNDWQNRKATMAVGHLAARVSVLLGGPDEPEPI
jgi:hypothetical protein